MGSKTEVRIGLVWGHGGAKPAESEPASELRATAGPRAETTTVTRPWEYTRGLRGKGTLGLQATCI